MLNSVLIWQHFWWMHKTSTHCLRHLFYYFHFVYSKHGKGLIIHTSLDQYYFAQRLRLETTWLASIQFTIIIYHTYTNRVSPVSRGMRLWSASSSCFCCIDSASMRILEIKNMFVFNPSSAGIVFLRQNLTSIDVRFWRKKTVPSLRE